LHRNNNKQKRYTMDKLLKTKKITKATFKAFAKRNAGRLYVQHLSSFNGMEDMVTDVKSGWKRAKLTDDKTWPVEGVFLAYNGNIFELYEDAAFIGVYVYNAAGSDIIAVQK